MKGKLFKYDDKTGKMVEVSDAHMMPLGEVEVADGVKLGVGVLGLPIPTPNLSEQERDNLKQVLRKADEYAEKMDRRDCNRVQEEVARMRERFGIDE